MTGYVSAYEHNSYGNKALIIRHCDSDIGYEIWPERRATNFVTDAKALLAGRKPEGRYRECRGSDFEEGWEEAELSWGPSLALYDPDGKRFGPLTIHTDGRCQGRYELPYWAWDYIVPEGER